MGIQQVVVEKHRHEGIFVARGKEDALVTKNLVPGESVYGEKRISTEVRLQLPPVLSKARTSALFFVDRTNMLSFSLIGQKTNRVPAPPHPAAPIAMTTSKHTSSTELSEPCARAVNFRMTELSVTQGGVSCPPSAFTSLRDPPDLRRYWCKCFLFVDRINQNKPRSRPPSPCAADCNDDFKTYKLNRTE